MQKDNILLLLTPKTDLACIQNTITVRQALEKMRAHGYMAIPVISKTGEYVGTITEGDLLYCLMDEDCDLESLSDIYIDEIIRKTYTPSIKVDTTFDDVANMITEQNFVPVVDDRNILMGIITRKKVLQKLLNRL